MRIMMIDEAPNCDDNEKFAANVEKESNLDNLGELDLVSID